MMKKMKLKRLACLIISTIFFIVINEACNSNYDPSTSILDTTYHSNGNIKTISRIRNQKKDSIETSFYESSSIKSLNTWKDGLKVGTQIDFYDGVKNSYLTVLEGDTVLVEESQKKSYRYIGVDDNFYELRYNQNGIITEENGSPFILINFQEKNNTIQFIVPFPENITGILSVSYYNKSNEIINSEEIDYDNGISSFLVPNSDSDYFYLLGVLEKENILTKQILKSDTIFVYHEQIKTSNNLY